MPISAANSAQLQNQQVAVLPLAETLQKTASSTSVESISPDDSATGADSTEKAAIATNDSKNIAVNVKKAFFMCVMFKKVRN
jgi:hypothetical protein